MENVSYVPTDAEVRQAPPTLLPLSGRAALVVAPPGWGAQEGPGNLLRYAAELSFRNQGHTNSRNVADFVQIGANPVEVGPNLVD